MAIERKSHGILSAVGRWIKWMKRQHAGQSESAHFTPLELEINRAISEGMPDPDPAVRRVKQ